MKSSLVSLVVLLSVASCTEPGHSTQDQAPQEITDPTNKVILSTVDQVKEALIYIRTDGELIIG